MKHLLIFLLLAGLAGTAFAKQGVLRSGDNVNIVVYGHPDLGARTTVSEGGTVSLPLLKYVWARGKTARSLERDIAKLLAERNFVKNPSVTVEIEKTVVTEQDSVTLLGEVDQPGRYPVNGADDGAQTLVGLLALAGGVTDDAGDEVILNRTDDNGNKVVSRIDLLALMQRGDLRVNQALEAGDVVMVPRSSEIFVYGEVRRPGRFRLERDMTVVQALALSGGLTPKGTEKGLTVRRTAAGGDSAVAVEKVGLDDKLMHNDVLYVRAGLF